jgi:hypothetical protein
MLEWVPGVGFERNYIRIGLQGCVPVWVPDLNYHQSLLKAQTIFCCIPPAGAARFLNGCGSTPSRNARCDLRGVGPAY